MNDAIAFFLTWPTYGTWLPGDKRGWIEYGKGWQWPNESRRNISMTKLNEQPVTLSEAQRLIVESQVEETCSYRNWRLYAVNCRSNHMHVVVGAENTNPQKARKDLEAWCSRKLTEDSPTKQTKWWAERGSIRWIFDEQSLDDVFKYVTEAQEEKSWNSYTTDET